MSWSLSVPFGPQPEEWAGNAPKKYPLIFVLMSVLGIWSGYGGRAGLESRQGREISVCHNVQTGSGTHQAFYSVGTGVIFQGLSGRGVKFKTGFHLVLRIRMSGALPLYSAPPRCLHGVHRDNFTVWLQCFARVLCICRSVLVKNI